MPSVPKFAAITSPRVISEVIARLRGGPGAFAVPLYAAALAGEIRLLIVMPGGRVPMRFLDHAQPPTVVALGGDPGAQEAASPPTDFPQVPRLIRWAASTLVHATGGQAAHYRMVVDTARLMRRVLLVETATAQEDAWTKLVRDEMRRREETGRRMPSLVISARPKGGVHPVQEGTCR
ncbi:hypothetical protein [Muricoccus radiodurans]|uniref:hypothetical protein n=1 Tax=Muricoccus radiodurans TaxID=2231721 RepID=UPI003CE8034E